MKSIYILGAGNFAQEVYSEVFLQGNASQFGKFQGYIYLSKLNNPILIDEEMKKSVGFTFPKDAAFVLATGVKKWRHKFIDLFTSKKMNTNNNISNKIFNINKYCKFF